MHLLFHSNNNPDIKLNNLQRKKHLMQKVIFNVHVSHNKALYIFVFYSIDMFI